MRTLVALLVCILLTPVALACSCVRRAPQQALQRADLVFAGRVEQVTVIDGEADWEPRILVRFTVGRTWKGNVPAEFTMHTHFEASSCRGFFRELATPGEELLVFARAAKAVDWKGSRAAVGSPNAGSYTVRDPGEKSPAVRQDLVDAVPDAATIYTTDICSGSSLWKDADIATREFGEFRTPKGGLAMNDPPLFDDSRLSPEYRNLPQVCWAINRSGNSVPLDSPPPESGLLEKLLRDQPGYGEATANVTGKPRDRWWRDPARQELNLCRTTRDDLRDCGVLFGAFEKTGSRPAIWEVQEFYGKPCPAAK